MYVFIFGNLVRWLIIFLGYRWLFEIPKNLHRDISLNNLVLRKEGDKVYTVLNDFDLAVSADIKSKQRTGTKPFMAIDLLRPNPPGHMYRNAMISNQCSMFSFKQLCASITGMKSPFLHCGNGRITPV
jgi:hypothetical protein